MTKQQFIRIEHKRYKLSIIKRYEPFTHIRDQQYGLYIYFSAVDAKHRTMHLFDYESIRDDYMSELDHAFGLEQQLNLP